MDEQEYTDYKGEITISCGSTIEILATQEADGYSFQNWSYKYEGNTKTSSENPITITPITDNCILTPVYKLKECTITIESNDGKKYTGYYYKGKTEPEKLSEYTTGEPIQAVYNETITLKPYEREGYHFTGWDYKPKDNVRTDENGNLIISPITTSYVITPQYEINTYSVNILKPDNINTTCKVNVKVNNTEYNNQSLPYTKSDIEYGSEVTVSVVSDTINGYKFQKWDGDKSSDTTTVTIDYITKPYTIKPIYEEMIELTFIKPDYVTNFKIEYTIAENENSEEINFGDEESQIVSLPKSTNIKVTATTADTETETDIPCGGWEKDGVFTVPATNPNKLEINNLLSNTTIKPIYYYCVELNLYPIDDIETNGTIRQTLDNMGLAQKMVITDNQSDTSVQISDTHYCYSEYASSNTNYISSKFYYRPYSKVKFYRDTQTYTDNGISYQPDTDTNWLIDSWWKSIEYDENGNVKIPSNQQQDNLLSDTINYEIPCLTQNTTVYAYPTYKNIDDLGFRLGYGHIDSNNNNIFIITDLISEIPGVGYDTPSADNVWDNSDHFTVVWDKDPVNKYWTLPKEKFDEFYYDNEKVAQIRWTKLDFCNKSAFGLKLKIYYKLPQNATENPSLPEFCGCCLFDTRSTKPSDLHLNYYIPTINNSIWIPTMNDREYECTITIPWTDKTSGNLVTKDENNYYLNYLALLFNDGSSSTTTN